ncbi:hypothetical protein [Paratractidigestivibacter sp.]|uniref:hypothetical protein n=1 Tax=Paratractidigestivibacter sp. TaxID=2847316 RepID=UPI002AC93DAE|nr:hypothetical protein [Paratractidigestivibacter sp.]
MDRATSGETNAASSDAEDDAEDDAIDVDVDTDADAAGTTIFARKEYKISAIVLDRQDVNAGEGTISFRSSGGAQYAFFVTDDNVETDVYTVVYLAVSGADAPLCYSDEHEGMVDAVKQRAEGVREERRAARGDGIRADANATIDEAEATANQKIADGQKEIDDAQAEHDANEAQLLDGMAQLEDGIAQAQGARDGQVAAAKQKVEDAVAQQFAQGRAEAQAALAALDPAAEDYATKKAEL